MKTIGSLVFLLILFTVASSALAESDWSEVNIDVFVQGCVAGIVDPARRDYYARAKEVGDENPKPFPEQQLKASVRPMCSCVVKELRVNGVAFEEAKSQSPKVQRILDSAMRSGQCKFGGAIGEALNQKIKRQ